MLKRALVFWIFLMIWSGTATVAAANEKPFIFGLLLAGPENDHGWRQAHYESGKYIEKMVTAAKMIYIDRLCSGCRVQAGVAAWWIAAS
jgi:basic membrane protein A and related proteins